RERAPLSYAGAMPLLRDIAKGLQAAHESGIVHRDLKPANVMVVEQPGKEPVVKLLDFGIAKLVADDASPTRTRTGTSLGSPHFMAPEQCLAQRDVDHRADVYALGVMAYLAFTGRVPFHADSSADLCYMHVHMQPDRPSVLCGIPESIESIVLKA